MAYRRGNYDFVIDSSFQPFSMQEMLVPYLAYKEAYEESEKAYTELSNKADTFAYLSKELPEGSKARQIYEGYANELHKQAVDLASNGLNMNNRGALTGLKRRYQGEIGMLANAETKRQAQIAEQRKLLLTDPTRLLSRRADLSSLDDYLENPDLSYEQYSGAMLAQQVGTAASAIAKSLRDYGNGKPLDGFTKTWLQQHGYTAAEVAQAIQNPALDKTGVLSSIVEQAVQSSGVPTWADTATLNQAYAYARQGLWNAVGQTQIGTYTDEAAKLAAQEESQKRVAKYAADLQNQNLSMDVNPKFDRRNVRTTEEVASIVKERDLWEKYRQYFYKDEKGTWHMNNDGRKMYNSKPSMNTYVPTHSGMSKMTTDENREFKDFVNRYGLSEMANNRVGKGQSENIDKLINRVSNIYDAKQATEYTGLIDASQYDNVISSLNRASDEEGKLVNYERRKTKDGYSFVPTKDKVDVSKLTNADVKSAVPVYGVHGNFLEVSLKGGQKLYIPYNQLNSNYDTMIKGNINDARALEIMKQRGMETFTYSDGRTVPIDVAIMDALNQGFNNFMSGLGTSTVEPQKTNRNLYQMR